MRLQAAPSGGGSGGENTLPSEALEEAAIIVASYSTHHPSQEGGRSGKIMNGYHKDVQFGNTKEPEVKCVEERNQISF